MKTLPDNPNLDHLRQQAKDLLAGLRESTPGTSLADAQASLARQYGFRSWTDLKAEVDRVRGRAEVADPALARELAARFGLGEVTAIVESFGGHRWRVYQWLHSGPPLVAPVGAAVTHRVGVILARIHGLRLPVDRVSPWHATRLSSVEWKELAAAAHARGAGWADAFIEALPLLADLDTIGAAEPASASVLCHNSLGPTNARLDSDGEVVVFGWEHAGGQPPAWELGDALTHWTTGPGREVNAAGARALVEGYRSEAGAVPALDPTMFSGAATSLLNYVCGEVEEALNAADAQERRYRDRSMRHLLSHLPSRATFETLLAAARGVSGAGP